MGQRIGKASFEEDAKPFLNLPAHAINSVWTTFNLSAEGWGLRLVDFVGVCAPLGNVLGLDDPAMQLKAEAMFALLDTDGNGIVDALEFMATLVRSPLPWFLSSRSEGVTGQGSEWRFCVLLLMVVVVVVEFVPPWLPPHSPTPCSSLSPIMLPLLLNVSTASRLQPPT